MFHPKTDAGFRYFLPVHQFVYYYFFFVRRDFIIHLTLHVFLHHKNNSRRCQRSNPERAYGIISIIVRTSKVKEEVKNGLLRQLGNVANITVCNLFIAIPLRNSLFFANVF